MAESENPYQVSRASIETYGSVQDGIEFTLGKMLSIGFKGFFSSFLVSIASGLIHYIVRSCASLLSICGGFVVWPHLIAGMVSYGSGAARGEARLEDLFKPFNNFGGVFLAGLLYFLFILAGFIVTIIAYTVSAAIFAVSLQAIIESGNLGTDLGAGFTEDTLGAISVLVVFTLIGLTAHYFMARLDLVYPLVYDLRIGPWDAFVQSWRLTRGHGFSLFMAKLIIALVPLLLIGIPYFALVFGSLFLGAGIDVMGFGADEAFGAMFFLFILLTIVLVPVSYGLMMVLEGAIANLFLTPAVKEQLMPGYEERQPRFVSSPATAGGTTASTDFVSSTGLSGESPDSPSQQSETGSDSPGRPEQPDQRPGQSGPPSGEERFPRPDQGKKDDPFNPYN
ncbi:MAG: hypothetical protein CMF59_00850 [Leptospiraceae bacterium]|nr:hypothetical protein [Leptospiraceae bacterium]